MVPLFARPNPVLPAQSGQLIIAPLLFILWGQHNIICGGYFFKFFLEKAIQNNSLCPKIALFILWLSLLKSSCMWDCKNELLPPYCHKTTLRILPLPWRTPLLSRAIVVDFLVSCVAKSWKATKLRCSTTNMMASLKGTKINSLKCPCKRTVSILSRNLAFSLSYHNDEKNSTAAHKSQNGLFWGGDLLLPPHPTCLSNCSTARILGSLKRRTLQCLHLFSRNKIMNNHAGEFWDWSGQRNLAFILYWLDEQRNIMSPRSQEKLGMCSERKTSLQLVHHVEHQKDEGGWVIISCGRSLFSILQNQHRREQHWRPTMASECILSKVTSAL